MRKEICLAASVAVLNIIGLTSATAEESVLHIGGASGWKAVTGLSSVTELDRGRRYPALILSSARSPSPDVSDLSVSFDAPDVAAWQDACGRYQLETSPEVFPVGPAAARMGSGAASFPSPSGDGPGIALTPGPAALFAPSHRLEDFTIEFWLYPTSLSNGEQFLSWTASLRTLSAGRTIQTIRCYVAKNRIQWGFSNLFASSDRRRFLDLSVGSRHSIAPRAWSHHLLRFKSDTGLLEYLVNGELEGTAYATESAHEGGEVWLPFTGSDGSFILAPHYTGLVDELRIAGRFADRAETRRFADEGGRIETRPFDLGSTNTALLRLEAKTVLCAEADIRFFIRVADEPYGFKKVEWQPVTPGRALKDRFRGRWIQIAADFYPSASGEGAPILESIDLFYKPDLAPPPPAFVVATARDGAVELRWKASPDPDLSGYMVYYGERSGEYFGTAAAQGSSPLDVGLRTSVRIDGLRDGRLYYFVIAAYDGARHVGEFSREATARPVRMEE